MQPDQQDVIMPLDAKNVVEFLSLNPDFFDTHSDVLTTLRIPHHTGGAISLIEKQLSVLRKQCASLESKLNELISVARENENLHTRMHQLIQEVISAPTLDAVIALTRESLIENFNADALKIMLIESKGGNRHETEPELYVAHDEPGLNLFEKNFTDQQTLCGSPDAEVKRFLFQSNDQQDEDNIGSVAVIPLHYQRSLGLAVLSSADASRFDSEKGVMFLNQLGEVLSRRIAVLV